MIIHVVTVYCVAAELFDQVISNLVQEPPFFRFSKINGITFPRTTRLWRRYRFTRFGSSIHDGGKMFAQMEVSTEEEAAVPQNDRTCLYDINDHIGPWLTDLVPGSGSAQDGSIIDE